MGRHHAAPMSAPPVLAYSNPRPCQGPVRGPTDITGGSARALSFDEGKLLLRRLGPWRAPADPPANTPRGKNEMY